MSFQSFEKAPTSSSIFLGSEQEGTEFDKLRDLAGKLPVDGKAAFVALIAQPRLSIEELFKKVLAIPGVNDIAKPVIDGLRAKLDALSKA